MTIGKLAFVLTGMFVTGTVFFAILVRRSAGIEEELHQLRKQIRPAA